MTKQSSGPSVKELSGNILRDGYLSKQGMRTTRWQLRWFVLTLDNVLYYFKTETAEEPKGIINLRKYTHVSSGRRSMSFSIYHDRDATRRAYHMACELATDMQEWMTEIDNAIKRAAGVLLALDGEKGKFNSAQLARMLSVTVVEARNLTGKDPYVIAQLATRYVRTRTIQKTQDPFWGDSYVIEVDDEVKDKALELQVTIMDDDWFSLKDRVLGKVVVPVNSLLNGKLHEQWYPLVPSEAEAIVAGMLNLRLEYVGRTLHVRVVQGRELASRNSDGSSDPFVEIRVDNQVQKTPVVKKTLNPFWNKKLSFEVHKLPEHIHVICYDHEVVVGNKFLGEVYVALSETDLGEKIDRWYMLSSGKVAPQPGTLKKTKSGSSIELSTPKKGGSTFFVKRSSEPTIEIQVKTPSSLKHSPSMPLTKTVSASASTSPPSSPSPVTLSASSPASTPTTARSLMRHKESSVQKISVMNGRTLVASPSSPSIPTTTLASSHSATPPLPKFSSNNALPISHSQNPTPVSSPRANPSTSPYLSPTPSPSLQPRRSNDTTPQPISLTASSPLPSSSSQAFTASQPLSASQPMSTSTVPSSSSSPLPSTAKETPTDALTTTTVAPSEQPAPSAPPKPLGDIRLKLRYMASVILPFGSYEKLLELLLDDNCNLAIALGLVVAADERENLATNLVKIFTCRFSILTLLKRLTEEEIQNTPDAEIIFRSNSLATKAVEYYMRLTGASYLTKTIGPSIRSIIAQKRSYEVDSMKAEKDEDIDTNQKRLIALAEGVSLDIFQSEVFCPTNFREIFAHLQDTVAKKWGYGASSEKVRYSVVSGFLFLRFFCPALLGPKLFNLMDNFADPKTGRTFTLLSKIMQNLANLVEFGQKEPYMGAINPFVLNNFPNMRSFLDKIATPPRGNWPGFVDGDHPQIHLQKEMAFLHSYLLRHKSAILNQPILAKVKDKLVGVLADLDAVILRELKERRGK